MHRDHSVKTSTDMLKIPELPEELECLAVCPVYGDIPLIRILTFACMFWKSLVICSLYLRKSMACQRTTIKDKDGILAPSRTDWQIRSTWSPCQTPETTKIFIKI